MFRKFLRNFLKSSEKSWGNFREIIFKIFYKNFIEIKKILEIFLKNFKKYEEGFGEILRKFWGNNLMKS